MGIGKHWEGELGGFSLRRHLGGSENSDVFLTEYEGQKAAIKLVPAEGKNAEAQLARWQSASKLSHSHLIRIYKTGRGKVGDAAVVYVVMEYADEILSDALSERPLSAAETREMLDPVLSVLAYLHREGFAHGHLKPSNILAVNDHLKVSGDGVTAIAASVWKPSGPSSPNPNVAMSRTPESGEKQADDVWSVGLTLIEALTQRREAIVPATLPQPFLDIARGALNPNPEKRWTVPKIEARLRGSSSPWPYIVSAAAVVVAVLTIWLWPQTENKPNRTPIASAPAVQPAEKAPEPTAVQTKTVKKKAPEPVVEKQAEEKKPPPVEPEPATPPATTIAPTDSRILQEVLPDMTQKARNTIHGKAMISVTVRVDPEGNVAEAKLGSVGRSKYFERQSLKAAKQWKFQPSEAGQNWIVRFELTKTDTKAVAVRVAP